MLKLILFGEKIPLLLVEKNYKILIYKFKINTLNQLKTYLYLWLIAQGIVLFI